VHENWWHCNKFDIAGFSIEYSVPKYSAGIILQLGGMEGIGRDLTERLDDITLMLRILKTAKIDFTTFLDHETGGLGFVENSLGIFLPCSKFTATWRAGYSHYRCNESN